MTINSSQFGIKNKIWALLRRLYAVLAPRAFSAIIFGALFCNLAVKLFHAIRQNYVDEYFRWILMDIVILLGIEVVLSVIYFRWHRRWVFRAITIFAAVVCTWSVINAGWLIRTGTQVLPATLLPLFRDPLNAGSIIGINFVKMPVAAVILLGPSAIALVFFFSVLAKPRLVSYNKKSFTKKICVCVSVVVIAALARIIVHQRGSIKVITADLHHNCQLKALTSLVFPGPGQRVSKTDIISATRKIPAFDEINITLKQPEKAKHNVVLVVLEGIQYNYISLAQNVTGPVPSTGTDVINSDNPTPFLASLAEQGVEFANTRSTLTHTTKALFSLLTGRYPSVSQDLAEAVPVKKPYASIATILKQQLNYRTAYFQSAKGNFEGRPGLVSNLGFEKFWARDDLDNTDAFVGYLGCDEFAMLEPITKWIEAEERTFFLTIMCSVSHDPYVVPEWYAEAADEPAERYKQTISYSDSFLRALNDELASLNLTDNTIFCVFGDHGEAFGEHGLQGHEGIAFEETLRVPWVMREPGLVKPATRVRQLVSSIDLAPTLLGLLGFDITAGNFDGANALGELPKERKVYFSGWSRQSPAGYVKGNRKFIYYPTTKRVTIYDLSGDLLELTATEPAEEQGQKIIEDVIAWRSDSIFQINQQKKGEKILFDYWLCWWNNRVSQAKHQKEK